MTVIWAPETAGDFSRIYSHNVAARDEATALDIENKILNLGDALVPNSGTPYLNAGERRIVLSNGYLLFFRVSGQMIEIFAVYHQRENWAAILQNHNR